MNERFGILHLSDIHASEKSKVTIQRLVGLLKADILTMQERHNVSIKMICISGDLINSGDEADVQLDIILEELLQPLMDLLNLDEKGIFVVAGNHEIKRKILLLCFTLLLQWLLPSPASRMVTVTLPERIDCAGVTSAN